MLPRPCSARWLSALVPLVLGLAGCGDSGEAAELGSTAPSLSAEPVSPSPTPPSTASPSPSVQVIEVHIADGEIHTDADRVEMTSGAAIRLIVTSDAADELHVHGADATAALVAGVPTTLDFTISEPGVFDVETHDSGLLLVQLLVR